MGPLTEVGDMGGSRFKGKVNEFGFRHFELQVVLWDNQQEVGNFVWSLGNSGPERVMTM